MSELNEALFILVLGDSLADGRREPTRLQNTDYNYYGIGAGYPAVRTTQDQYVADPPNVFTFYKPCQNSDDMSVEGGTWQAYEAGVNSSHDDNSFGTELSLATQLAERSGKPVYIIKAGFGGTRLSATTPSADQFPPGNWNPTCRYVFMEYWVKRAMRDFRSANPTLRARLVVVDTWLGTNDGVSGIATAVFEAQYDQLKTYLDNFIASQFVIENERRYIHSLVRLHFDLNASETAINTAIDNIANTFDDVYVVDSAPYPRGVDLTAGEAAPLAVGNPNADGGLDNNHTSYIGMLGIGELIADNVENAGLL